MKPRPLPLALAYLTFLSGCTQTMALRVPKWFDAQESHGTGQTHDHDHPTHEPRLSDKAIPLQVDDVPERPHPILEVGDPFLGTGEIRRGIEIPTGAVLQPSLLVYGTARLGAAAVDQGGTTITEVAGQVDLFANLQLSGTERVLVGFRPLDQNGRFTSYVFEPASEEGWKNELNGRITTLFFEGDLGEIFPRLDPKDHGALDYGLAVGRQPLTLQEGLLLDDRIDAFGITRNTLRPPDFSNLRLTGLFAWNQIHRDDGSEDSSTNLVGLLTEGDRKEQTLSLDVLWLNNSGDRTNAAFVGVGSVQRIGSLNTAFRAVGSFPFHGESTKTGRGGVFLSELSHNVRGREDLVYLNGYFGLENFSSASRAPELGGPLGRVGILFGAVGLGRFPPAITNDPDNSFGGALGYQWFSEDQRTQIIVEIGGREQTRTELGEFAIASRFSRALGQHVIFRMDGFVTARENDTPRSGFRTELDLKL
ncbi:MAG: hypothetical protein CMJ89_09620 [Planctomycetes bacterium]|nr:hypothetical protein [Planctomycetota bacterium]